MVEPYKPLYTVKQASKILLMNEDSVRGYIKSGQLPALRLGAMKIRGSDLERFIEKYPAEGGDNQCRNITLTSTTSRTTADRR